MLIPRTTNSKTVIFCHNKVWPVKGMPTHNIHFCKHICIHTKIASSKHHYKHIQKQGNLQLFSLHTVTTSLTVHQDAQSKHTEFPAHCNKEQTGTPRGRVVMLGCYHPSSNMILCWISIVIQFLLCVIAYSHSASAKGFSTKLACPRNDQQARENNKPTWMFSTWTIKDKNTHH